MLFLKKDTESDAASLYAPQNSRASKDREIIRDIYSEVQPDHDLDIPLTGQVIIIRSDRGNVLTVPVIDEVLKIHEDIMSITIESGGKSYNIHDLCVKAHGNCYPNGILELLNYNSSMVSSQIITYPTTKMATTIPAVFLGNVLAGVQYKPNSSEVASAASLQLMYNLRHLSEEDNRMGNLWLQEFLIHLENVQTQHIDIVRMTSTSLEEELSKSTSDIIGLFAIAFSILIIFAICSCAMTDWVRSKTLLASVGVLSAGMAIISSFGLLTYLGLPFIDVVASTPFLIIGKTCKQGSSPVSSPF